MADQARLFPKGLPRDQFATLVEHATTAEKMSPQDLSRFVNRHVQETELAFIQNRMVNARLAKAIAEVAERILQDWESFTIDQRYWLGGAIYYFADSRDNEHDFNSPIGFEDDAEVLNVCLAFANRPALCIAVEDYDHA
jgi:hypothetical protein